jgi:hypothetical protein
MTQFPKMFRETNVRSVFAGATVARPNGDISTTAFLTVVFARNLRPGQGENEMRAMPHLVRGDRFLENRFDSPEPSPL